MKGWIGVDLDGTLAHYDGWKGLLHIGEPVPLMQNRVISWLNDGHDVRIFTARISDPSEDNDVVIDVIETWCEQHLGSKLPVTNVKDFEMVELWDDRCVQVHCNSGIAVGKSRRGLDIEF